MIIGMDNDPFRNVCWFKIQKLQFGKIIFRQFFRNSISIEKRIRNWKFTERERERDLSLRFDNSRERMKGKSVSNSVKKSSSFLVGGRSPGLDGNFFIMWRGRKSVYIEWRSPPGVSFMRNLYAKLFNPEAKLG